MTFTFGGIAAIRGVLPAGSINILSSFPNSGGLSVFEKIRWSATMDKPLGLQARSQIFAVSTYIFSGIISLPQHSTKHKANLCWKKK